MKKMSVIIAILVLLSAFSCAYAETPALQQAYLMGKRMKRKWASAIKASTGFCWRALRAKKSVLC